MSAIKPTLRDRVYTNWGMLAALINDGGTPERKHLEALLRTGEGDVPREARNYIADALYAKGGGRPSKSKLQAESDEWRRAESFVADIEARRAAGLSLASACTEFRKEQRRKATTKSLVRKYWLALEIVKLRRAEAAAMMQQAASLMGISEAELTRLIADL